MNIHDLEVTGSPLQLIFNPVLMLQFPYPKDSILFKVLGE